MAKCVSIAAILMLGAYLALTGCATTGCATTIYPPPAVTAPATVAVLDHGRHASLIVEIPGETRMIRYSYGDWTWYALNQTGAVEATSVMVWPSQGALGRRELAGPPSVESVSRGLRVAIENALFIEVESSAARELIARLDGIYTTSIATRIYNEAYDLEFVHHPEAYWIFRNSNRMVAEWLTSLACEVEGPTILSNWYLHRRTGLSQGAER